MRPTDYALCGWRVRSEVRLPEARSWAGDDRPPDITIRFGPAPDVPDPIRPGRPGLARIGRSGDCNLEAAGVARYLVTGGGEVVVEPHDSADGVMLRAWLLGPVLGILCHQRGLFPLHASCVRIGENAVALTGRPGAGKSTLAAALVQRGHGLVSDDVCAIDLAASGGPMVLPSFPRLKLWEDAMERLGIAVAGVPRAPSDRPKFHFCQPGPFDPSPVRLRAIYVLDRTSRGEGNAIRPDRGAHAAHALATEIFRPGIGFRLGGKAAVLDAAMRIASAVAVLRVPLRPDEEPLDTTAARIEADVVGALARAGEAIAPAAR
jgi:HPr serine kinase-like protein